METFKGGLEMIKDKIKTHKAAGIIPYVTPHGDQDWGEIKFLLIRTSTGGAVTGWWEFPKGHVEEGESLLGTAKRETEEETGLIINNIHPSFKHISRYLITKDYSTGEKLDTPQPKTVTYFLGKASSMDVRLSFEHSSFGWFTADEANKKLRFSKKREVLHKALNFIQA